MTIAALFAPKKSQPQAVRDPALQIIIDAQKQMIAKLRADIHNLHHRRSGTYNFRLEDVKLMAQGVALIESGEYAYGLRLLTGVMDDLRPDWRELS